MGQREWLAFLTNELDAASRAAMSRAGGPIGPCRHRNSTSQPRPALAGGSPRQPPSQASVRRVVPERSRTARSDSAVSRCRSGHPDLSPYELVTVGLIRPPRMDATRRARASIPRDPRTTGTGGRSSGIYRRLPGCMVRRNRPRAWWPRRGRSGRSLRQKGVTMTHMLHGLTKWAAPALVVGAVAAPTAGAQSVQDMRSPDARDAATVVQSSPDLRSPDVRDAAWGRGTASAPQIVVMKVSRPHVSGSKDFDWADAGIGAGAVFGLVLLGVGATLVVAHRGRDGAKRSGRAAPPLGFDFGDPVREPLHPLHSELASGRDRRWPSPGARSGRHVTTQRRPGRIDHEV
jgi:hypothetical protein